MTDMLSPVKVFSEAVFSKSTQKKYWQHTERVFYYAEKIGLKENANLKVLLPATYLHDVGMTIDDSFQGHVEKSMLLSKPVLKEIGYVENDVSLILKVIGSHHPVPGIMLDTLEEKILYDADNMDIIGVFGVLRWIGTLPSTAEELNKSIDLFTDIVEKCVKARGSLFFTETARQFGDPVVISTLKYLEKLKSYINRFGVHDETIVPLTF